MREQIPIKFSKEDFDKSKMRKSYFVYALKCTVSVIFAVILIMTVLFVVIGNFGDVGNGRVEFDTITEKLSYLACSRSFYLPLKLNYPGNGNTRPNTGLPEKDNNTDEKLTDEDNRSGNESENNENGKTDTDAHEETVTEEENTTSSETQKEEGIEEESCSCRVPTVKMDMTQGVREGEYLCNFSDYSPDVQSLLLYSGGYIYNESSLKPLVLVLHSHSKERYSTDGRYVCFDSNTCPSCDEKNTVVGIGDYFVFTLNSLGIPAVHCSIIHDDEGVLDSTQKVRESIDLMLDMYPSIKYIIDIHRSSEMLGESAVRTSVPDFYTDCAQVRLSVSYSKDAYLCNKNLMFALSWMKNMNSDGYKVCRPVCLHDSSDIYYGYYIIVELGSMGNTSDEAKLAAYITARALSRTIKGS